MKANSSKKTLSETSFDQLDWKNGSLTGNGLKQAVDMFKAQDASKQTVVIYDRKSEKTFNILDVRLGKMNSGHGIEIDVDTSKAIQEESENMKNNKEINEAADTIDWAADGYGKENAEQYTWKVLRKIFPHLQFNKVSSAGPSGWPEIKVTGKDRDVRHFMDWWHSEPSKDNKFWKKIMDMLEKIYGKSLSDSDMKEDEKPYYTSKDEKPTKIVDWKPTLSSGKSVEVNEINPYPKHMWAAVERVGAPRSGKWQVIVGGQELLKTPLPRCKDANEIISQFSEKYWRHLDEDESELTEADDRDPLSHALDLADVKASTANSKAQDEVQMTATDGNTTAGIDAAIDRDIDAAMEEIYK